VGRVEDSGAVRSSHERDWDGPVRVLPLLRAGLCLTTYHPPQDNHLRSELSVLCSFCACLADLAWNVQLQNCWCSLEDTTSSE
jgi:hypothetical protein